jgi:drug/metabolite transporter (DMT)-like permease
LRRRLIEILQARTGLSRFLPIGTSVLCLTAAVLFVKYFSFRMDVHTQNFFRYCGASVFLSVIVNLVYPGCFRRLFARLPVFLLLGAMVVGFQICWVNSVYRLGPAFVSLLGKVSTILITVAAFLLYQEERSVVGTRRFLAGFVMGLTGMAGVVIGMPSFQPGLPENELAGVLFLLAASTIWAVYVNVVKHVVASENSVQAFTFTCVCATVYLLPIMLLWGEPSALTGDMWLLGLVLLSGIIGVAGANTNYYLSIKRIGIARSANLALAHPFTTALASFFIFGEILTVVQWVFGTVLIAGCALIISIRERRQPAGPAEDATVRSFISD